MKWWINNPKFVKWMRIIHRDLGYLMVGMCLVYGISGMLLNHMKEGKDPAHKVEHKQVTLEKNLSVELLTAAWEENSKLPKLNKVLTADEAQYQLMLKGGIGMYDKQTGEAQYEISTVRPLVYWINRLHYNRVTGWSLMANVFAGSLIFFALSGLVMVKGKKGVAGRGKWYLLAGLLIPIIYVLLT